PPVPTLPAFCRIGRIGRAKMAMLLLCGAQAGQFAHAEAPPIKPGLWEITTESRQLDGKPLPDLSAQMTEHLKKMPPEMRKKMEAQMKAQGVQMVPDQGGTTVRVCLTKQMLEQYRWQHNDAHCENTATNRSAATWTWRFKCTQPPGEGEGTTTFYRGEEYRSEMRLRTEREGKTHLMTTKHRGKWLGTDCGGLRPVAPPSSPNRSAERRGGEES